MNIKISDEAAAWYKEELGLTSGSYLRFFVRYGGQSIQKGFSLGIASDPPTQIGSSVEKNGVTFYVEDKDLWFFEDYNLVISFNEKLNEPEFEYEK